MTRRRVTVPTLKEAKRMMAQVRRELKAHTQQLEDSRKITVHDGQRRFR
jgi:hypothetical protein